MSKKYQIYGIGNALVDQEFEVDDAFFAQAGIEKGMMTLIEPDQLKTSIAILNKQYGLKKRAGGGSATNTVVAASSFGTKNFYSCQVANDEIGDFYLQDLKAAGVDTNMGENREDGDTGSCLVMVTPDAERTMNTYLGITALFGEEHLVESALADSEYLYIEGYLVTSPTAYPAVAKARQVAKDNNVKIALTFSDPAMVQFFKDGLKTFMDDGVDLLFCNEVEALNYTDSENLEEASEKLKQSAKSFAITLGANGALVWDGEKMNQIKPVPCKALDSNGAGDMFAGAYIYGISQGWNAQKAGDFACLSASTVVSQFGPRLDFEQHATLLDVFNP